MSNLKKMKKFTKLPKSFKDMKQIEIKNQSTLLSKKNKILTAIAYDEFLTDDSMKEFQMEKAGSCEDDHESSNPNSTRSPSKVSKDSAKHETSACKTVQKNRKNTISMINMAD